MGRNYLAGRTEETILSVEMWPLHTPNTDRSLGSQPDNYLCLMPGVLQAAGPHLVYMGFRVCLNPQCPQHRLQVGVHGTQHASCTPFSLPPQWGPENRGCG